MLSPDQTLSQFAAALWQTTLPVPEDLVPSHRFAIYRNNVYAGLIGSLTAKFPVVRRLVGEAFFTQCARLFVEVAPPVSPILDEYGARFAEFLSGFEPASSLPYLSDIARLEWQIHTSLLGPEADVLDAATLSSLPPDQLGDVIVGLHATAAVIQSRYPIFSIWRTNRFDAVTQAIAADAAGESVLVVRPLDQVQVLPLTAAEAGCVRALAEGQSLGVVASQPDIDFTAMLAQLLRAGVFSHFHMSPDEAFA